MSTVVRDRRMFCLARASLPGVTDHMMKPVSGVPDDEMLTGFVCALPRFIGYWACAKDVWIDHPQILLVHVEDLEVRIGAWKIEPSIVVFHEERTSNEHVHKCILA